MSLLITEDCLILDRGFATLANEERFLYIKNDLGEDFVDDNGKSNDKARELIRQVMASEADRVNRKQHGEIESSVVISASQCVNVDPDTRAVIEDDHIGAFDAGTLILDHDVGIFLVGNNIGLDLEEVQGDAYNEYMLSVDDKGQTDKSYQVLKKDALIESLNSMKISKTECKQIASVATSSLMIPFYADEVAKAICK